MRSTKRFLINSYKCHGTDDGRLQKDPNSVCRSVEYDEHSTMVKK